MTWTKFSERLPEESATEVFVIPKPCCAPFVAKRQPLRTWKDWSHLHAWHPITYPEVPKEESQHEKDEAEFRRNFASACYVANPIMGNNFYVADVWRAALRYERAEVAKDIRTLVFSVALPQHSAALDRLRRRVGLDK